MTPSPDAVRWLPLVATGQFPMPPSPSPEPPYAIAPGTPNCVASQLEGESLHSGGATGNVNMPVLIRNRGTHDCVLTGYPDVAVIDSAGRTLASVAGATGRGTYFNDGPVVPILARAGTGSLPGIDDPFPKTQGQVFLNISWYDCRNPLASRLALDLPDGGGRLVIPFAHKAAYYMLCDTNPSYQSLVRGPFSPAGIEWPPGPHYLSIDFSIDAPGQAAAGTTITYFVTITNKDTVDYVLSPCPDYIEILGVKTVVASYELNCSPVRSIPPSASVTFEMRMALPKTQPAGIYPLTWSLADGRIASHDATATLSVT